VRVDITPTTQALHARGGGTLHCLIHTGDKRIKAISQYMSDCMLAKGRFQLISAVLWHSHTTHTPAHAHHIFT